MERKINQVVKLSEITFDADLYPRSSVNWQTSYDYAMSMNAGVQFPPIILAVSNGKKILVDGKHRIDAMTQQKITETDAVVHIGWSRKKIFEEAVKSNISHGRTLSPFEKRRIALKLRDEGYNDADIVELIQVPADKLDNFVGQRLVNSITGEVIVKSEIKHLTDEDCLDIEIETTQQPMKSRSQVVLLKQVIYLFEKKMINKTDKVISKLLKRLKKLL